jgi:ASC-1-like (ASCH) protein
MSYYDSYQRGKIAIVIAIYIYSHILCVALLRISMTNVQDATWSGWSSGEVELAVAKRTGRWEDGQTVGRGHGQPYLQPVYAHAIRDRSKTVEGRPGIGWAAGVKAGDWITFKITGSGGKKLVARALRVRRFDTFEAMLGECGVESCLPGLEGRLHEGVRIYRSFGTFCGATYAELEAEHGAIAIDVAPLRPKSE